MSRSTTGRILESMSLCFPVRAALLALKKVELLWRKVVSAIAFSTEFQDTWASQEARVNASLVAARQNSPSSFAEGKTPKIPTQNCISTYSNASCTEWSSGHPTEHSIANAYIEAIGNARHFVYIENQVFWITDFLGVWIVLTKG